MAIYPFTSGHRESGAKVVFDPLRPSATRGGLRRVQLPYHAGVGHAVFARALARATVIVLDMHGRAAHPGIAMCLTEEGHLGNEDRALKTALTEHFCAPSRDGKPQRGVTTRG